MSQTPTVGRVVLYKLAPSDVVTINASRANAARVGWNVVTAGDEYPALVVRVFGESPLGTCNLQVILDGCDNLWATSRYNADCEHVAAQQAAGFFTDGQGCWRWPPRA